MMYISRVELTNIRCIEHVVLDLESKAPTNKSLVLLGDNGVGKSTILRSIAIGLCDRVGASGLLSDMYGDLISERANEGSIKIDLKDEDCTYSVTTNVTKPDGNLEELTRSTEPKEAFPWDKVFVCAYGANRGMQGTKSYDEYSIADAVYSLFNYSWALQNPELVLHRRVRLSQNRAKREKEICDQLAVVLMLDAGDVRLSRTGITVKTHGGHGVQVGALADGHESTLTWILDIMGWMFLAQPHRRSPRGIVLIDELEQHLHPRWQRQILRLLHGQFRQVQFIVTTHSALCAAAAADLDSETAELQVLNRDDDGVVTNDILSKMDGWRYDQILTSAAFGLPLARGVSTEPLFEALRTEYTGPGKPQTSEFKRALRKLEAKSIDAAADERQRQTQERLAKELAELRRLLVEKEGQ